MDLSNYKKPEDREPENNFRGARDELVDRLVQGINRERLGTKWKPVSHKTIALRVNNNPTFTGRNDNLLRLINECEKNGKYSKFFWACPLPTNGSLNGML